MFEGQPQAEIDALMKRDPEFKQLYQRHRTLDKKVMDAELGVLPLDDATLVIRDGRIVGDSSLKEIVHDDVYSPA